MAKVTGYRVLELGAFPALGFPNSGALGPPAPHAPTHAPSGTDPLGTASAVGIGGGNAEGTADTFARSDHNHAITETSGSTDLTVGSIVDGQLLARSGTSIVGVQDPTNVQTPVFLEDWQSGTAAGTFGQFLWQPNLAGPGSSVAIALTTTPVDASHQGILTLTTGTNAATGRAGMHHGNTESNVSAGGNSAFVETLWYLDTLSTALDEYRFSVGWSDATLDGLLFVLSAIQFVYDRASFGGNWIAQAAALAVPSNVDTGVAVVAATWIKLRVDLVPGVGAEFRIASPSPGPLLLVATIPPASLPSAAARFALNMKARNLAALTVHTARNDYTKWGYNFSAVPR